MAKVTRNEQDGEKEKEEARNFLMSLLEMLDRVGHPAAIGFAALASNVLILRRAKLTQSKHVPKQSNARQSKAKQSKAWQSKAKQSKANQGKAKQLWTSGRLVQKHGALVLLSCLVLSCLVSLEATISESLSFCCLSMICGFPHQHLNGVYWMTGV